MCALLVGCGHPATKAECEEIFERSAEIELRAQKVSDPGLIEERTKEARAASDKLLEQCVGRRVTESAMECIRAAQTAGEFDACLN